MYKTSVRPHLVNMTMLLFLDHRTLNLLSCYTFFDLYFLKKVKVNIIKSSKISELFEPRAVPYGLRLIKEESESNTNKNYIYFSIVSRIKRELNTIVTSGSLNTVDKLSSFKIEVKKLELIYILTKI